MSAETSEMPLPRPTLNKLVGPTITTTTNIKNISSEPTNLFGLHQQNLNTNLKKHIKI